jgi:hypothetical protein
MSVSDQPARGRTALPSPKFGGTGTQPGDDLGDGGRGRVNRVVLAPVAGVKSAEAKSAQPGLDQPYSPMTEARRIRLRGEYGIGR